MKKLVTVLLLFISMFLLIGCDFGTTVETTEVTTVDAVTTVAEEVKPTFLGMKNGTSEDFVSALSLNNNLNTALIRLSSPIISLAEENYTGEFIEGARVVVKDEEVVILFDILQPAEETYIRRNFAVQLYSNYNFTTGELMPEGTYDYEWFARDYEGFGALYMLKTDTPNLDTLVIKIPIKGDYSVLQEIGVQKINYDGENGVELNYSAEAISNLTFAVAKKTSDNYIYSFLNTSYFNRETNVLSLYLGDVYSTGEKYLAVYENTLYNVSLGENTLLVDYDLLLNAYIVERTSPVSSYYLDIDLSAYISYTTSSFELSFSYFYLVVNGEAYSTSFIVTIDEELGEQS